MYPFNATTQSVQIIQDHSTRWGQEKDGGNKRWINGQIDRKEEDTVEKDGGKDTVEKDQVEKDTVEKDEKKDKIEKDGEKDKVEKNEEKDKIEKDGSRRIRLRRIRLRRMEGRIRLEEKDEENDIDINYREGIRQNRFIQLEYSILNVYVNQYTRRGI